MADLQGTMQNTLTGQQLNPVGAPTSQPPAQERRPEDDAFERLARMIDEGQLKLTEQGQQLIQQEIETTQAEPTVQGPGALQSFGAALSGLMGAQFAGQPGIATSVLGALEGRRREAAESSADKVTRLRLLRQEQLKQEISSAEQAGDAKLALMKAREINKIEEDQKKELLKQEGEQKAEAAKLAHGYRMREIELASGGRIKLAERKAELDTDRKMLEELYGVPKHVAQAMQDARKSIQTSTDSYIRGAGGLGMVDTLELARLQAAAQIQMEESDNAILERYQKGTLGGADRKVIVAPSAAPPAAGAAPAAPGPAPTAADMLKAHQEKMRAAVGK